jgi:hypothetical protein
MAYRRIPPNSKIIHIDGNGHWWFWNEDWNARIGPYDTEEEAKAALDNLSSRWFGFDMSRVVPTTTPTGQPVDLQNDVIYQNFRT